MGRENAVYLAHDESRGVDVAIKENTYSDPAHQRQFRLEGLLLANLRHPNIPRGIDSFDADGRQFIVMDFIEGINLLQLPLQRKPGTEEILHWAARICDTLAYLHSLTPPILHRDVEPSNIILTGDGRLFLIDFGLAKVYNAEDVMPSGATPAPSAASSPDETSAPVQHRDIVRTDPRTDQYSLAATIYCLLTGAPPVDSLGRLFGKVDLQPIRPSRPDLSASAEEAIFRALSIEPDGRFSDIGSFKSALRAGN